MSDEIEKDRKIFMIMRKVLASIIKDTTPNKGMKHILQDTTIEDIRMCLSLISAREQELAKKAGVEIHERPRYVDEPTQAKVVSLSSLKQQKGE